MYLERTNYFVKDSHQEEVLQLRRKASEVRMELSLPFGVIRVKENTFDDGPDVQWECDFLTVKAHNADLEARAASAKFEEIRRQMGMLIERFERHFFRNDTLSTVPRVIDSTPLGGVPIVPREETFHSCGLELKGYLYLPPGEGPFPCMVTNHGSTLNQGSTDICRPSLAAILMSWGIASFLPHRRGYGNSPGISWQKEAGEFGSETYASQIVARLVRESDDVISALRFLEAQPEIQADHIGVMGCSFGGINTLLAAAKCPRFRCAVNFAGAAMNWESTPKLRDLMKQYAEKLTQPIFLIQAENDYSTGPTRDLEELLEKHGKIVEAQIYPGFGLTMDEGHHFEHMGTIIWGTDVRHFLEKWL
jgi:carboxymethylenebutenolidase